MDNNFTTTRSKSLGVKIEGAVLQISNAAIANQHSRSPLTLLLVATLVAIILIKLILSIRQRYERHKIFDKGNMPSVGRKNPFSGNFYDIFRLPNSYSHILKEYHEKLGKNYGIFYGPDPWVVTMDVKLIHKVMVVDGDKHTDYNNLRFPYVDEFNKSIFQSKGSEWRRMRRFLNPPFAHRLMKTDGVLQAIDGVCKRMLACIGGYPLEAAAGAAAGGGGVSGGGHIVDTQHLFKMFTIEVIFKVAFGRDNAAKMLPGARDEFSEDLQTLSHSVMSPVVPFCIMFESLGRPLSFLIFNFTRIGQMLKEFHSRFDDCLLDRRTRLNGNELSHQDDQKLMIDTLIELRDSNKIDEISLKANMIMTFLAGFETTANSLTTLLWLLAGHQNIQEKLRQAIMIDGEEATYLDWCIKEAMRLYPAVPMSGRLLTEDLTTPQGQTIFKGTSIGINIYSIHHGVEYWGEDVEEFRPERFSEPLENPSQFIPFGNGIRGCLGKNLAMTEMRAAVTQIVLNFKVVNCDSTPDKIVWSAPNLIHTIIEGPINLKYIKLT